MPAAMIHMLAARDYDPQGDARYLLGSIAWIGNTSKRQALPLVNFQNCRMLQQAQFIGPLASFHLFAVNLTQITLHVDAHIALTGQILYYLMSKIISQQRTKMIHTSLFILQLLEGERGRLCQHTLGAIVHICTILILEEYICGTLESRHSDSCLAQFLYFRHYLAANRGHHMEVYVVRQRLYSPSHIVSRASCTMGSHRGILSNNPIASYMSDAANICHKFESKYLI